jgi:hypothetical protein
VAKEKHAVFTVYIDALKPRAVDRKQVDKWLQDLNSDAFKTRDAAHQELQKLRTDAKPFLREALKAQPALETRRRIEALLEKMPGFDVTDLEIPKGIAIITMDDRLASSLKDLTDADRDARSFAIQNLSTLAPYSDKVVPALIEMYKKDKDDHVRRVAAASLASICVKMKTTLPVLKEGLEDSDAYIRNAFQTALDGLAKAKATPGEQDRVSRELAIAREISEFKNAAGASK